MRVILFCRLRTAADCRPSAPAPLGIIGSEVMHKIMFAAALAVGLITTPVTQLMSTAAAQQPASTSDKTAKPKREPSAGQLAARERQKKCAAQWKEAKAGGKIEKGETWPKYWSACNKRLKAAAN